jgi:hypothetical protein
MLAMPTELALLDYQLGQPPNALPAQQDLSVKIPQQVILSGGTLPLQLGCNSVNLLGIQLVILL